MMGSIVDVLSWGLLLGGAFFTLTGTVGVLRFPDVFTRLHGAGMTDTMGAGLILLGLCLQAGVGLVAVRLILIVLFLWFTSPIATHALAKAALHGGLEPWAKAGSPPSEGGAP